MAHSDLAAKPAHSRRLDCICEPTLCEDNKPKEDVYTHLHKETRLSQVPQLSPIKELKFQDIRSSFLMIGIFQKALKI